MALDHPPLYARLDDYVWKQWFQDLWNANSSSSGGMVPYEIQSGETFTIPVRKQALFNMVIDVAGILVVDGFLIHVAS